MTTRSLIVVLAASLALAACGDDKAPAVDGSAGDKARGEVLGGSVSDAMLPLDSVSSQSPPLREDPTESTDAGESGDNGGRVTQTATEAAADASSGDDESAPASDPAEAEAPAGE